MLFESGVNFIFYEQFFYCNELNEFEALFIYLFQLLKIVVFFA